MAPDGSLSTVFRRGTEEIYRLDGDTIPLPPETKVRLPDDPERYRIVERWFDVAAGFVYYLEPS